MLLEDALRLAGQEAVDGVALLVGGATARDGASHVYQLSQEEARDDPVYVDRFCELYDADTCVSELLVFSSPPQSLPVLYVIQLAPARAAHLLIRFAAAAALVAGMLLLWKRLAHLSPRAPTYLAVTAALLTLYAVDPVAHGQNTPFSRSIRSQVMPE